MTDERCWLLATKELTDGRELLGVFTDSASAMAAATEMARRDNIVLHWKVVTEYKLSNILAEGHFLCINMSPVEVPKSNKPVVRFAPVHVLELAADA